MLQSKKLVLALDWTPNTNHSVSLLLLLHNAFSIFGSTRYQPLSTSEAHKACNILFQRVSISESQKGGMQRQE